MMEPVSVCHHVSTIGTPAFADHAMEPLPGGGIDRLADGAKQTQTRQIVPVGHCSPCRMRARIAVGDV